MNNLTIKIPLFLRGFETLYERIDDKEQLVDPNNIFQLHFENISAQEWYNLFYNRLIKALGKSYLPIYRMADGEFIFITSTLFARLKRILFFKKDLKTCWGENYTIKEYFRLKNKFTRQLREISRVGILAMHFVVESQNIGYSGYINPVLKYLSKKRIYLNQHNYIAFYFIYALLSSNDSLKLFKNNNVLIITHTNDQKRVLLERYFISVNVGNIEFYNISKYKSFLDVLDLDQIKQKPDIVLVGAGIGAINIICQLQPLNVPCIDAGYMLEVYANENLRGGRIYVK